MKQRWISASMIWGLCQLLLAGCLPDDPAVMGRSLYRGSNVERPTFVTIGDDLWVLFQVRQAKPTSHHGGVVDLHLVKWADASQEHVVLAGRADRAEWPVAEDAAGARFYMTDERPSLGLPVGTLRRLSLADGVIKESIPDVMSYALNGSRTVFYYRKYVEGAPVPELHLRDLTGRDRNLGALPGGQVLLLGEDTIYFIGNDHTLTRVDGFDGAVTPLRAKVQKFQLGGGAKFALAQVTEGEALKTVVLDFVAHTERPLPIDAPWWLGLSGNQFTFSTSAKGDQPAALHYYDVVTGADRVVPMPIGLNDVVSMMPRPPSGQELLIFDSRRRVAAYRPGAPVGMQVQLIDLWPTAPQFTPDGRFLIFLVPEPPPPPPAVSNFATGQLYAQSAEDWTLPPKQLSPDGASVPIEPQKGYLVRDGHPYPLVFWARFGLGASDLFLSDYETGANLRVAAGIGAVSVSQTHVLGVLNMSQDLTGELVFRDFVSGKEKVIERGVSEVEFRDNLVAFIVHERMASSPRNGLWASMVPSLDDPPSDAAASMARIVVRPIVGAAGAFAGEGGVAPIDGTARDF